MHFESISANVGAHLIIFSLPHPTSLVSFPHLSISFPIHHFTLFVTLEHDWLFLIAGILADLQTFIGWVCRFSEVGGSMHIFTTFCKLNIDIALLQPSIMNAVLGSVIHSARRSEESSGGKVQSKEKWKECETNFYSSECFSLFPPYTHSLCLCPEWHMRVSVEKTSRATAMNIQVTWIIKS